jgi:hypothetical protein
MVGSGFKKVFHKVPHFTATAKLHPNDHLDKIIGKKIALTKAMIKRILWLTNARTNKLEKHIEWYFSKQDRTEIWKAFWTWVVSWKKKKKVEFVGYINTITVPPLSEQHNTYTQMQISLDTRNLPDDINRLLGKEAYIAIAATRKHPNEIEKET